jgi:hypothetical protein
MDSPSLRKMEIITNGRVNRLGIYFEKLKKRDRLKDKKKHTTII